MLETKHHSIANRAFRPIGKKLKDDLGANFIFIALQPEKWEVNYFGTLPDHELNETQQDLRVKIEKSPHYHPEVIWNPGTLHACVKGLMNHKGRQADSRDYLAAAQSILSSKSVALGNTQFQHEATRTPWCLQAEPKPLKLFQTAIKLAHNRDSEVPDDDRADPDNIVFHRLGSHRKILKVDGYLKRKGIIDRKTAPTFIAEYLTALDGHIGQSRTVDPAKVKHLFLPLSGLGQWRASASWFQINDNNEVNDYFHSSELAAMDELYTYAIIDSFIGNMSSQILLASKYKRGAFIRAFSELFWSLEIAAYNYGEICEVLLRNESGELERYDVNNCHDIRARYISTKLDQLEFLTIDIESDKHFNNVQINLLALLQNNDSDILNERALKKFFGFDTVVLSVPFIDIQKDDIRRYSEYLRERLRALLELQIAKAGALEREGMSFMSHFSKGWINATDHTAAADGLRACSFAEEPTVAKAIASLEMFQNVIAAGDLIRLWTIDSDQDHSKIKNWVNEELVAEFHKKPDETFQRYSQFIKDTTMTILYGLGYENEFRFEVLQNCGNVSVSLVSPDHAPMSNMERWILNNETIPPFDAGVSLSPHNVLLALIAEPIYNAVTALENSPECSGPHISVKLARKNNETFLIEINNIVCKKPPQSIPSLERIDVIYRQVELAAICSGCSESPDGKLEFSVKIELTPCHFAERLLNAQQD